MERVFKVGSMADSLRIYVPIMAMQRVLGLGRVLIFAYLLAEAQYGLWALGSMIFAIGAPILTLGSNHGLVRYVSFYEARGQLQRFYRRIRWSLVALCAALGLLGFLGSDILTRLVIVSRSQVEAGISYADQLHVCWVAVANCVLLALYTNTVSVMYGLRAYRMVSTVAVLFSVLFTIVAVGALLMEPTGLMLLVAHLISLALAIAAATAMLEACLKRMTKTAPAAASRADSVSPPRAIDAADGRSEKPLMRRVIGFGVVALIGSVLWQGTQYISFWITSYQKGKSVGGVFFVFLRLGQPGLLLANAAWSVIFTHVAQRWENLDRPGAMFRLETAYKAVCLATMTVATGLYLLLPLWVRLLPAEYRQGQEFFGGILMYFQVVCHLSVAMILAKLHERPVMIVLSAVAGGAANALLCAWWLARGASAGGWLSPAWAAGVGIYVGAGLVGVAYLLLARVRLSAGTWLMMAVPGLLLLPTWALAGAWAAVLTAAAFTGLLFNHGQKQLLIGYVRKLGWWFKRDRPC